NLRDPAYLEILATGSDKNVGWFDVPMDDPLRMGGVERVRDLDAQIEHHLDLQWFSSDLVLEGFPFQVLHGDEGLSFIFPNVVNRADIRVIECRERAAVLYHYARGTPPKKLFWVPVVGERWRIDWQRTNRSA